jgi:hypothetical protein
MSAGSRVLTALYLTVTGWLAFCTIMTGGAIPLWATGTLTAATVVPLIACIRETVITDERRQVAVLIELDARREAWSEPLPADGRPLDDYESAKFKEITGNDDDRSAA